MSLESKTLLCQIKYTVEQTGNINETFKTNELLKNYEQQSQQKTMGKQYKPHQQFGIINQTW